MLSMVRNVSETPLPCWRVGLPFSIALILASPTGPFVYRADIQMAIFSPYQKLTSIAATDIMEPIAGQVVIHDMRFFIFEPQRYSPRGSCQYG
jgi:hypothetical protein